MVRIILADDHRLLREGLRMVLARRPDLVVTAEAGDGYELLNLLQKGTAADLLIVDLSMPGLGGIEAIREIRKTDPNIKVLVLTMHQEEDFFCQAFLAGADGYLLKDDLSKDLFNAIDTVLAARVYISPFFDKGLQDTWLKVFIASKGAPAGEPLSEQEMEVLRCLAAHETRSEIAKKMGIPAETVLHHGNQILRKLHMKKLANHA